MTVATPAPGASVMTNMCKHCGEKIERFSGSGQRWQHGEVGSHDYECDAMEAVAHRISKAYWKNK